jgi:hypothetical protein
VSATHSHDCGTCRYVRSTSRGGRVVDWYVCSGASASPLDGSVIGRYGSDGGDYWSMPVAVIVAAEPMGRQATFGYFLATAREIVAAGTLRCEGCGQYLSAD